MPYNHPLPDPLGVPDEKTSRSNAGGATGASSSVHNISTFSEIDLEAQIISPNHGVGRPTLEHRKTSHDVKPSGISSPNTKADTYSAVRNDNTKSETTTTAKQDRFEFKVSALFQ